MNLSTTGVEKPTRVRYGVLGFACSLSMITYLDRVCFGTVATNIQSEFGLSNTQLGMLFSGFALAYAAFEVPSGWLGDVYGPKRTLIRIVLWWSLFTALTGLIYPALLGPALAFYALLAVRFLFGMGEAGAYPNIAGAFHKWFPFQERAFATGAVWMAGRFAGGVTSFIVGPMMYETTVAGQTVVNWRHIFWIFGGLGVFWCILFWAWFRDRPEQHPSVNQAELAFIHLGGDHVPEAPGDPLAYQEPLTDVEADTAVKGGLTHRPSSTGIIDADLVKPTNPMPPPPKTQVPWGKLLTSANLWILCMMYFCAAYGWYFNITYLPGYLRTYFGLTPGTDYWKFSLLAGAPLLLGSLACLLGGILSDFFIKRTGNRKWGRRLFGVIGHGLCAACYFAAIFADSAWLFVLAIAMAAFWNDITMGAAWASCIDIGRKYSGIVSGCMNTIGNLGGFAAGFLTGHIIDLFEKAAPAGASKEAILEAGRSGWTVNFLIFGGVYVAATLLWLRFDSTKPVAPEENR